MKRVLFSVALLTVAGQMYAGCCYAQQEKSAPVVEETKSRCGGCGCQDEGKKAPACCQDGCDCDGADVRCDACCSEEGCCGSECTDCTNCDEACTDCDSCEECPAQ